MSSEYFPNIEQIVRSFDNIDASLYPTLGGKSLNLVIMRKDHLPIPFGYSVTNAAHEYYIENNQLPYGLVSRLTNIKNSVLGGKIIIRSDANCEDSKELSMAGVFESICVYNDEDIADTVIQIYEQSRSRDVANFLALHGMSVQAVKMGLIVQELLEPNLAGVIYTGVNGDNLLVQYVDGFGARLVDGKTHGSAMLIQRDGKIIDSTGFEIRPFPACAIHQIRDYSFRIIDLFGGHQDIEFAYTQPDIHILQARPLTTDLGVVDLRETPEDTLEAVKIKLHRLAEEEKKALGTKTVILSDANYSELLPRPKEMDIGTHMYVWGGSDGVPGAKQIGHRLMGYLASDATVPIISFIGGRTYFSIARSAGLYHIGFPESRQEYFERLVNEYLGAVLKDPDKGSYPQMGLFLQDPTLDDLVARFGDRAQEYFEVYKTFAANMRRFADEFLLEFQAKRVPATAEYIGELKKVNLIPMSDEQIAAHVMSILEHNRAESYVDFVKCARLGFYYSQRLHDMLCQHLGIEKGEAKRWYSLLNQGLSGSAITEANIAIARAQSESEALHTAQELIGHYSTGEMLEIRHTPMRDSPERLIEYIRGIRQSGRYEADFEKQRQDRLKAEKVVLDRIPFKDRDELARVMQASQTYMAARETAKYYLTKEYLYLRDALELLGKRKGLRDGEIYHLYPREVPQFAVDPNSLCHLIRSRNRSFDNYAHLDLPSIIKESDIDQLTLTKKDDAVFTEGTGKFLADGPQVTGIVVNIDEFDDPRNLNEVIRQYQDKGIPIVIAASQLNLSHDTLIAQSDGLAIKNAGIVAHGAQRARELGKGAIGGIDTRLLKTGMEVSFDPRNRTIRNLNAC